MSHPNAIVPARLEFNAQGIPLSSAFGDVYRSGHDGLEQARHVFIGGNDLPQRWQGKEFFTVLETGFGPGLNFLATWQAWRTDPHHSERLHFVSVEKHPFQRHDLAQLHQCWPELAPLSVELLAAWPPLTPGCHRILLDHGRVTLTLFFGDALSSLPKVVARADALYLDGFAPARNPNMWTPGLIKTISRLCNSDATLATWSVATDVHNTLANQGWQLLKHPGLGRKREMLTGRRLPQYATKAKPPPTPNPARRAIVIGAGVAGCAMAERLAMRGWQVDVLEKHTRPAQGASGNPIGLMHPVLSRDDNFTSRITRACALYGTRLFAALDQENPGLRWKASGVLQLARDQEQDVQQRDTIASLGLPPDHATYVDASVASTLAGATIAHGAWHYPDAGWISPPSLCQALLARHGDSIRLQTGVTVARLQQQDGGWQAVATNGQVLAEAPLVIVAAAHDSLSLLPDLPLDKVRGQVSIIEAGRLPDIQMALCGNGYLTPAMDGHHCFGATFDFKDDDPLPRPDGHLTNLGHLQALLPTVDTNALTPGSLTGRVGFRTVTPDRLPLVGAVADAGTFAADPLRREAQLGEIPRIPGLYCLVGLGSRGMVWAPLAAELLAARLCGEPLPLERELADALDPGRFLLRAQRRS